MRAREDRRDCIAHASFEAALCISRLVEGHQRIQVLVGDRATECLPCEIADDFARTGRLIGLALGPANHNLLAADGVAHPCDCQRPADLQGVRSLDALLTTLKRSGANALVAFGKATLHKRYCHLMLPRCGLEVDL